MACPFMQGKGARPLVCSISIDKNGKKTMCSYQRFCASIGRYVSTDDSNCQKKLAHTSVAEE